MKERAVDRERAVVAHHQAAEVSEPGVLVRSTIQRRLYRRSARPSCVAGFLRLERCGAISSIPRRASRSRNGSLS